MGLTKVTYSMIKGAPINVLDFGAVGDGVTNDTDAIQSAIDELTSGGVLYFPNGTYAISDELIVNVAGITFIGDNRWSTQIKQLISNKKIFNITANFTNIQSLGFIYSNTPISGATAIYCSGSYCTFENFIVRNSYIGIEFDTGVAGKVTDFEIFDYEFIGIYAHDLNDLFISNFVLNAGNTTRGALGGIRLYDKTEAIVVTDGDILLGKYSMVTDGPSNTVGNRPAYNNFTNVFFDSSSDGVLLQKGIETEFVGCWFSNGRSGSGVSGCTVGETDTINFVASRFFNCGSHGCLVSTTARRTTFTACSFESNSVTKGVGVSHGLAIASDTTDFIITNCKARNGLFGGQQGYGILVNTGTSNGYSICNNMLTGNYTAPLYDGGSGTIKTISGNVGYKTKNVGTGTITLGNTSVVISHGLSATPLPEDILISPLTPTAGNEMFLDSTSITNTQFTVRTASPATGNFQFSWQAMIKGN